MKSGCDRVSNLSCATANGSTSEECQGPAGCEFPLCLCMAMCPSCVSIDPWRVESGDGAVAG